QRQLVLPEAPITDPAAVGSHADGAVAGGLFDAMGFVVPYAGAQTEPLDRAALLPVAQQVRQRTLDQAVLPRIDAGRLGARQRGHHLLWRVEALLVLREEVVEVGVAVDRVVADDEAAHSMQAERDGG